MTTGSDQLPKTGLASNSKPITERRLTGFSKLSTANTLNSIGSEKEAIEAQRSALWDQQDQLRERIKEADASLRIIEQQEEELMFLPSPSRRGSGEMIWRNPWECYEYHVLRQSYPNRDVTLYLGERKIQSHYGTAWRWYHTETPYTVGYGSDFVAALKWLHEAKDPNNTEKYWLEPKGELDW